MSEIPGLREAAERLRRAETLVLACHVGPDGDALGSMLAVATAAAAAGVEVFPSFGEPFVVPRTYQFLPVDLLVPPGEVPAAPEVMVCFDAGSPDRLGSLEPVAGKAETLIVVDHHASNTGFGHLNLIVADAAASAEIALPLIRAAGWQVDQQAALCLLTALVTDTGRFQYSNTTPQVLRIAAELVEAGARPEVVGQHVYEETPFGYLHLASRVLGRAVLEPERRLVWTVMYQSDLAESGVGLEDTDPLIDAVRTPRESDVALLLKVFDDGRVKGSLRSRGRVDVGAMAVALGGGGHHNAAGFTVQMPVEELLDRVRSLLDQPPGSAGG